MRNLDKYAATLCYQFTHSSWCSLAVDCKTCGLSGVCCNEDKLLEFMMQPADEDDQQLLREPQGTE